MIYFLKYTEISDEKSERKRTMKLNTIDITMIDDFLIGNAEDRGRGTGCTVIISEKGAVGGVDVRGGGPATRETDLLRSENTVEKIHAVVLSGGSAFGLEADSGVARELSEHNIGFSIGDVTVPLVCGASLFDLQVGDPKAFPDVEMGIEAARNAFNGRFRTGNSGAGTGASVGKIKGMGRAMKTGLGTFACGDGSLEVGAVVAVNAVGDVYNGAGNIIAGLRSEDGQSIYGTIRTLKGMVHPDKRAASSDDIDAAGSRGMAGMMSRMEHKERMKEVARAIKEEFRRTNSQYSKSEILEADRKYKEEKLKEELKEAFAAEETAAEAAVAEELAEIAEAAEAVEAAGTQAFAGEVAEEKHMISFEPEEAVDDGDLGYDIPFNTTIGCLITNARLTKSQSNKLAAILHDAYARAIKPVHSTLDGDTIFVLASGKEEVNFDAFAALATDVMQYAIIDAAMSAKTAYGLPAAGDLMNRR